MGRLRRSLVRIGAMAAKETLHIQRDPRTLYLALGMPVVMLFLFGYGVSFDLERVPIAIADADRTEASRALEDALTASRELVTVARDVAPEDADRLFRSGAAVAVLVVPEGYGADVARGERTEVQLLVDGSDPTVANQVLTKADALARAETRRLGGLAAGEQPLQVKVWTRYNPASRSALFMVPGLVAYLLAITRGAPHRPHHRGRVGARLDGAALRVARGPARDRARQAPARTSCSACSSSSSSSPSARSRSTCRCGGARGCSSSSGSSSSWGCSARGCSSRSSRRTSSWRRRRARSRRSCRRSSCPG